MLSHDFVAFVPKFHSSSSWTFEQLGRTEEMREAGKLKDLAVHTRCTSLVPTFLRSRSPLACGSITVAAAASLSACPTHNPCSFHLQTPLFPGFSAPISSNWQPEFSFFQTTSVHSEVRPFDHPSRCNPSFHRHQGHRLLEPRNDGKASGSQ